MPSLLYRENRILCKDYFHRSLMEVYLSIFHFSIISRQTIQKGTSCHNFCTYKMIIKKIIGHINCILYKIKGKIISGGTIMKKLCMTILTGLLAITLIGCTQIDTSKEKSISKEEAINIALKHASLSREEVYDLDVDFDKERDTLIYEVNFEKERIEYEYEIDAISGEILFHTIDK